MKKIYLGFFCITIVINIIGNAMWENVNINGADITALEISPHNPSKIICGTKGCLFSSDDKGLNWTKRYFLSNYYSHQKITEITFHPTDSNIVYASNSMFLFKSTNGGVTWDNPYDKPSASIAFYKKNPEVYAFLGSGGQLVLTKDNGFNFDTLNLDRQVGMRFYKIQINPMDSNFLYILNNFGGIVSSDMGKTWQEINNNYIDRFEINCLIFKGESGNIVYATIFNALYFSQDKGLTWENIEIEGKARVSNSIAISDTILWTYSPIRNHNYGLAKISLTSRKLLEFQIPEFKYNSYRVDLIKLGNNGNDIFVPSINLGLFYSGDGGLTWSLRNNGLRGIEVDLVEYIDGEIFVSVEEGLLKHDPNNNNLIPINLNTANFSSANLINYNNSNDTLIYTTDLTFFTYDRGITWDTLMIPGVDYYDHYGLSIRNIGRKLWATGYPNLSSDTILYFTNDIENLFYKISSFKNNISDFKPLIDGDIFVALQKTDLYGNNLYRSSNNGTSWIGSNPKDMINSSIFLNQSDSDEIILLGYNSFNFNCHNLLISYDKGISWDSLQDCTNHDEYWSYKGDFYAMQSVRTYLMDKELKKWQQQYWFDKDSVFLKKFFVSQNHMFANTTDGLFHYLGDNNDSLTNKRELSAKNKHTPHIYNYPNPFNPITTITIPKFKTSAKLYIYDISGHLVSNCTIKKNNFKWNASHLPSGIYMIKALVEKEVYSLKIILSK